MIVFENEAGCTWISSAHFSHFSFPVIASDPFPSLLPSAAPGATWKCAAFQGQEPNLYGVGLQLPLSLGCVFSAVLAPHRALLPSASCFQLDTFPLPRPQAALASPVLSAVTWLSSP